SALTGANSSKSITAVGAARTILEKGFIDFLPYRQTLENRDVGLTASRKPRRSYATISIRLSSLRQQACFDAAISGPSLDTIRLPKRPIHTFRQPVDALRRTPGDPAQTTPNSLTRRSLPLVRPAKPQVRRWTQTHRR